MCIYCIGNDWLLAYNNQLIGSDIYDYFHLLESELFMGLQTQFVICKVTSDYIRQMNME